MVAEKWEPKEASRRSYEGERIRSCLGVTFTSTEYNLFCQNALSKIKLESS